MAFIRVKEIKNGRYAYLVENKWKKRKSGSRQRVSKYLGKVIKIERNKQEEFKMEKMISKAKTVKDLVKHELVDHGFGLHDGKLIKDEIIFDISKNMFIDSSGKEKNIVLEMNEGFLCKYTLSKLIRFRSKKDDERDVGIDLAKTFLEAGLKVPKDVFVSYFEKV